MLVFPFQVCVSAFCSPQNKREQSEKCERESAQSAGRNKNGVHDNCWQTHRFSNVPTRARRAVCLLGDETRASGLFFFAFRRPGMIRAMCAYRSDAERKILFRFSLNSFTIENKTNETLYLAAAASLSGYTRLTIKIKRRRSTKSGEKNVSRGEREEKTGGRLNESDDLNKMKN